MSNLPTLLFDAGRPDGKKGTSLLSAVQLHTQFPSEFQLNTDTDVVVSDESRSLRPQMAKAGRRWCDLYDRKQKMSEDTAAESGRQQ